MRELTHEEIYFVAGNGAGTGMMGGGGTVVALGTAMMYAQPPVPQAWVATKLLGAAMVGIGTMMVVVGAEINEKETNGGGDEGGGSGYQGEPKPGDPGWQQPGPRCRWTGNELGISGSQEWTCS